MGNIIDYVKWRGDLSFEQDDVNDLDLFALANICIIDFTNSITSNEMTIEELSKSYFARNSNKTLGLIIPDAINDLMKELAKAKRFKDILVYDFINLNCLDRQLQYASMTFKLKNNLYFIGFTGTDDSIVGWKEDLNLMYLDFVPAQEEAIKYIRNALDKFPGNFMCGGHSKGGNMAVVGSAFNNNDRIVRVVAYDSPGVSDYINNSVEYNRLLYKIYTYLPEHSIIGRLMNHKELYHVIKSSAKGGAQHDPISWEIMGKDFIYLEKLSEMSLKIDSKITEIIDDMNMNERKGFCEVIYKLLQTTKATHLKELEGKSVNILAGYFKLSKEEKRYIYKPVMKLIREKEFQKLLYKTLTEYRSIIKNAKSKDKK